MNYEARYDDTVAKYESRVRMLTGKAELAQKQLTELKINKHMNALEERKPGNADVGSSSPTGSDLFLNRGDARRIINEEEALDAYERETSVERLLATGNVVTKAVGPLPPLELYDACIKNGLPKYRAVSLMIVHNPWFSFTTSVTIVIASVAVGLETDNPGWGVWLRPLNLLCLMIFIGEVATKLFALRGFFWNDPDGSNWNKFDFIIVGLSLIDAVVELTGAGLRRGGVVVMLRVMRLLRVLRSLRTLKTSSSLMVLMESIGEALMPTTSVLIIILIMFYIFAILFTELVGKASHFEGDEYVHKHFGTVANSLGSLLQILTLDSWAVTCRYVQQNSESLWYVLLVWGLYTLFIVLAPLMMLNCLNAIFVEGVITKITHKKLERVKAAMNVKHEIASRLKQIFEDLDKSGDGFVTTVELDDAIETTDVIPQIKRLGLKRHHLEAMFLAADDNGDGMIDVMEFMRGFSDLLNIPLNRKDIVKMAAEQSAAFSQHSKKEMEERLTQIDLKLDAMMKKHGIKDVSSEVSDANADADSPARSRWRLMRREKPAAGRG